MSKPYDATTKDLIESDPAGWVEFLGRDVPREWVSLVDADVSTVSAEADKVIRVGEPLPWLLHIELQASRDETLPLRLLRYHALLRHRHGIPVASVAVLLRPAADSPTLTGQLDGQAPLGSKWFFGNDVVRVWERPAKDYLTGPIGLVPFAPLTATAGELPGVIEGMKQRLGEMERPLEARLWTASYVLMGLRFEQSLTNTILEGVLQMEESVTYQAILERGTQKGMQQGMQQGMQTGLRQGEGLGSLREARRAVLRVGRKRFGPATGEIEKRLEAIEDVDQLEAILEMSLDVTTWDELFRPG